MLTNQLKKLIKWLQNKKDRLDNNLFLVEGEKSILELLKSDYEIQNLILTEKFIKKHNINKNFILEKESTITTLSSLKTNTFWIAIVKMKKNIYIDSDNYSLVLDDINDPWNLWTIIRIADWYGIKSIIASKNTVDFYNPKVIISSMWSFCRVTIYYTDLDEFLKWKENIYWAYMNWENIYNTVFEKKWYILLWQESNWINKNLEIYISKKITIPSFWWAESLNVWVACWIIIDNIKRSNF